MKAVVIVPTYNEAKNIGPLLDALLEQKNLRVVVVDDNSPDGTARLVQKSMRKTNRIHLLSGKKQGLGIAYKRGMQYAQKKLKADVLVQMDADGSHNPEDIPRLLIELKNGSDMVIGSRYVPGGRTEGWGLFRHFVSWSGNLVARLIAGLWDTKDCTAGFRAIRSSVVRTIDWGSFPAKGYAFQIAMLHHAKESRASIHEIPIVFKDREKGKSKLRAADVVEFQLVAFRLGWRTHKRLLMFLAVGGTGMIVNLGLFSGLWRLAELAIWLAWAIALELSILWNFLLHESWTFRDRRKGTWLERCYRYHVTSLGGMLLNFVVFAFFFAYLHFIPELANFIAIVFATTWNYALSVRWAWKE